MIDEQNKWNALFTGFFLLLLWAGYVSLDRAGVLLTPVSPFDVLLMVFATFRVTRLFVYDHITQWMRDFFLEVHSEGGTLVRMKPATGVRRTIAMLLDCPWCLGVWAAFMLAYLHLVAPSSRWFILILAIAGASTFLQLLANLVGRSAEHTKIKVQKDTSAPPRPMTCYDCGL